MSVYADALSRADVIKFAITYSNDRASAMAFKNSVLAFGYYSYNCKICLYLTFFASKIVSVVLVDE